MIQCYDCGAPCGKRHPTGWRNEHFWCDKCARKHTSNAFQVFIGVLFLAFSAIVTGIVGCTVLRPIAQASGYATAKFVAIGMGLGGIVLFVLFRIVAGKVSGCMARMLVKLIGFLAFALGVGMLVVTFMLENSLKGMLGVGEQDTQPVESVEQH